MTYELGLIDSSRDFTPICVISFITRSCLDRLQKCVQRALHMQNDQWAHIVEAPAVAASHSAFCSCSPRHPISGGSLSFLHPLPPVTLSRAIPGKEGQDGAPARSSPSRRSEEPEEEDLSPAHRGLGLATPGGTPLPRPRPHLVSP
jgi:hypothetical protein